MPGVRQTLIIFSSRKFKQFKVLQIIFEWMPGQINAIHYRDTKMQRFIEVASHMVSAH